MKTAPSFLMSTTFGSDCEMIRISTSWPTTELRELEQVERPAYQKRRAVLVKLQGKGRRVGSRLREPCPLAGHL